jgi:ribosomal protein L31E
MTDRLITVSIRKYLSAQPRTKRPRKAAAYIKGRIAHYTKIKPENVKISQELNSMILKHYAKKMVPVKCTVKIGTDTAEVMPFGVERKIPTVVAKGEAKKHDKEKAPDAVRDAGKQTTEQQKPARTAPQQHQAAASPAKKDSAQTAAK